MALDFMTSNDVMNLAYSIAASTLAEYRDTIACHPPRVAACCAPSPSPIGSWVTSNMSRIEESSAWPRANAYGQLRMNAELPPCQTARASSSMYVVTPSGEIVPTQPAARSNAAIASGLFTVTVPVSYTHLTLPTIYSV